MRSAVSQGPGGVGRLRIIRMSARVGLVVIMCCSASLKMAGGYDASFVIGRTEFWLAAVFEVAAMLFLIGGGRCQRLGACMAIALGIGGGALSVAGRWRCGCLGVWVHMSPVWHFVLSMSIGALGAVLLLDSKSTRENTPEFSS